MNGTVVRSNPQDSSMSPCLDATVTSLAPALTGGTYPGGFTNVLKPAATTFQRCLLHRLADRFFISRQPQDNGYIRISKTLSTQIPPVLLIHLKPSEWSTPKLTTTVAATHAGNGAVGGENEAMAKDATGQTKTTSQSSSSSSTRPKKVKIMKRQPNGTSEASETGSNTRGARSKSKSNGVTGQTEKERQYAEARARIFQQSHEDAWKEGVVGEDAPSSSTAAPAPASATTTTPTTSSSSHSIMGDPSTTLPTLATTTTALPHPTSDSSLCHSLADPMPLLTTGTSTTTTAQDPFPSYQGNNKATYRNRQMEQADPDFQRRTRAPPIMTMMTTTSTTSTTAAMAASGMYVYGNTMGLSVGSPPYHPPARSTTSHKNHTALLTPGTNNSNIHSSNAGFGLAVDMAEPNTYLPYVGGHGVNHVVLDPSMAYGLPHVATAAAGGGGAAAGQQQQQQQQYRKHYLPPQQSPYRGTFAVTPNPYATHGHHYNPSTTTATTTSIYHDNLPNYNHPYSQQQHQPQQQYRRWHSDTETPTTTTNSNTAPSIHSSEDFPSLK